VWKADAPQDAFKRNLAQTRYRGNAIVTSVCVDDARVALQAPLSQQMACRLTRVQWHPARGDAMRTEIRAHGIDLSDDLRAIVHHETERLAQALRRRINTVRVDLYEEPVSGPRGHCARCEVDVLFDDGSCLVQFDEEDDFCHCVTEAFVKILYRRHLHDSRLEH
jgi:ribosome-associated translation inhibitor RaiA